MAARQADPASADVVAQAQALLDTEPPNEGRLAAWAALGQQAYLVGDDTTALSWADKGLASLDPTAADEASRAYRIDLGTTRLSALSRGGDPALALAALADAEVEGSLSEDVRLGLRAVALDRNAETAAAAVAYLQWRQTLADDDPNAPWSEHRARMLAAASPVSALTDALAPIPPSPARGCLEAWMGGRAPASTEPPWVQRCATHVERIGVMLPRTGPLSALADEQLVAASAAADVLGSRHGTVEVIWEDPGSTAAGARKAARALRAKGAGVIVGPIGPKLVAAAAAEVGDAAPMVVPGEGRGSARGVAPSLEARVEALVGLAKREGKTRLVVLAPDNGYGKRAIAAAQRLGRGMSHAVVVRTYPAGATSFASTLNPITTALSDGAALLIADHVSRAEMVVRQLARLGKVPAQVSASGLMVMATAEGASQAGLDAAGPVFEGVWASPVATAAVAGPGGRGFARAYAQSADQPPGDHAMLVYYAMHMAFTGRAAKGSGRPPIVRVVGGKFVAGNATSGQD